MLINKQLHIKRIWTHSLPHREQKNKKAQKLVNKIKDNNRANNFHQLENNKKQKNQPKRSL